jgi:hypothetical protein
MPKVVAELSRAPPQRGLADCVDYAGARWKGASIVLSCHIGVNVAGQLPVAVWWQQGQFLCKVREW